MAFNTKAPAEALVALLDGLTGVAGAQLGVPASVSTRIYATVTAASQVITPKTSATTRRGARYNCTLIYRLDGTEAAAEQALMDVLDLFIAALMADRTLGGLVKDIEIDATLADSAEYQVRAGKEYREFPILVTVYQDGSYTVNP